MANSFSYNRLPVGFISSCQSRFLL